MNKEKQKFDYIGKSVPLIDSWDKVNGKACYITDLEIPGMLIGKALRSPYAHAKIINIDTTKANKLPGVKCILTGKDVEQNKWGPMIKDQYLLAIDKVRYIGDEVVAIAAVDEETCEEALSKVKVEYEPLPAVINMFESIKENAPLIHGEFPNNINMHLEIEKGDPEKAFSNADFILEREYKTTREYHAYMETMGGVSVWDQHGNLTIYAGTQNPTTCRKAYAHALNIPVNKIRVIQTLYGGGFGAKVEQQIHPLGALISKYAGKPVKFVLNRINDFECCRPRVPMYIKIKTAWNKEGKLLSKEVYLLCDNGAYTYKGRAIAATAMYRIDALYKVKNIRAKMDLVYTNTMPTSGFRGYGNSQMHFALESHIDEVAEKLNIEPSELRLKNIVSKGYINPHGWKINSCEVKDCIKRVVKKSNIKHGIGLAIAMHVSGNSSTLKEYDGAAVLLRLNEEGDLYIYSNEPDMGQGIRTVSAISAVEILKMPLEKIHIPEVDTNIVPYGLGCWASRGTIMVSSATKNAAINLRKKIFKVASKMLKKPINELSMEDDSVVWLKNKINKLSIKEISWKYICDNAGQNLLAQGFFKTKGTQYPDKDLYGNVSTGLSFGCNAAEVKINIETGEIELVNVWSAFDVGQPINPIAVEGQIYGGICQGFGWAILEEMKLNKEGKLLNPSFLDYQIPTSKDIPEIYTELVDSYEKTSGYGAKGIGELALIPIVPAINNAIYNAIGIRFYELPFSYEKIHEQIERKGRNNI